MSTTAQSRLGVTEAPGPELAAAAALAGHLREDVGRTEAVMADALREANPFVGKVVSYLTDVGGKRLRPLLSLTSAEVCLGDVRGPAQHEAVVAAAIVELVHVGTLYHDDIIDEADQRRGVLSANHRWSNTVAVLAGDYLIARASELAASLGGSIAQRLSMTIAEMCRGQLLESAYLFNPGRSRAAYLGAIDGKTAALTASSCWLAASAVGRTDAEADRMSVYGRSFGRVFQIVDDFLDIYGDERTLKKPAGSDVLAGIYNLPIIEALAEDPSLRRLLGPSMTQAANVELRERIAATSAIERCVTCATELAQSGFDALDQMPSGASVERLRALLIELVAKLHWFVHAMPGKEE